MPTSLRDRLADLWNAAKPHIHEALERIASDFSKEGPFVPCARCEHAPADHCADFRHCHGHTKDGGLCPCHGYDESKPT